MTAPQRVLASEPAAARAAPWPDAPGGDLPWAQGSWAALVLSALLHALLLMLCAILMNRGVPERSEPDRPAQVTAVIQRGAESEYLQFDESQSTADAASPAANLPALPSESPPLNQELPDLPQAVAAVSPAPGIPNAVRSGAARPRLPTQADYTEFLERERAELRGRIPAGNPVGISLFGGEPAIGRSFVFLLDRSKSMGGAGLNALAAAAQELEAGLAPLEPVHRFAVVAYHHEAVYLDGNQLLAATEPNKARAAPFLRGLAAFGQTEHEMGLHAGLRLKPDALYLFTDGGDPYLNEAQLGQIRRHAAGQRTTIHCVHFGFGPPRDSDHFLVRLARENGGGYVYVDMSHR